MKRKLCFILSLLLALSVLPGCWSKREPKNLAIIQSVIYDREPDGTYIFTLEFLRLSPSAQQGGSGSSSSASTNIIEITKGATIRDAVTNLSDKVERKQYSGHNHARFFTERFARNGDNISAAVDFIIRDVLTDETPLLILVKGDHPEYLYSTSLEMTDTVGMYTYMQEQAMPTETAIGVFVTSLEFIKDCLEPGKEPVMGLMEIEETQDPTKLSQSQGESQGGGSGGSQGGNTMTYQMAYKGLAAFRGTTLVGFMDGEGARAYNIVTNKMKTDVITVGTGSHATALKINTSSCSIKAKAENGRITLDVKVKMTLDLLTAGSDMDIEQVDVQKSIEQQFNQKVQKMIQTAVRQAQQEFKSDIFGFGEQMHIQNPKVWKDLAATWNEAFTGAEVTVTVDATLVGTGQTDTSFGFEEKQQ